MYIKKILLENFRSYKKRLFEFDPKINLIVGDNGIGKTNLLESIYFLSAGKSFRASANRQLIHWQTKYASSRAKIINSKKEENEVEVQLIVNPDITKTTIARKYYVNKVEKTRNKYIGFLRTVIFHPDDIRLVTGSPGRRRDFLDEIFSQSVWQYAQAVSQYKRALKHRNELLDQIRLKKNNPNELFYWNQSLVKNDAIIHDYRKSFVKFANSFFADHPDNEIKTLYLNYHPSLLTQNRLDLDYDKDLACGYTSCGNHRDDFSFDNTIFPDVDKDLSHWGSRGQQRLAVLALRLAQIDYYEKTHQEPPVLLLDDIFSELDENHQQLVSKICHKYQTFITSAVLNTNLILPSAKTFNI